MEMKVQFSSDFILFYDKKHTNIVNINEFLDSISMLYYLKQSYTCTFNINFVKENTKFNFLIKQLPILWLSKYNRLQYTYELENSNSHLNFQLN